MRSLSVVLVLGLLHQAASQQIYDIWQTTWDRDQLLTYTNLGNSPINFVSPGSIGQADIVVNDGTQLQDIDGFGATLTDASAQLFNTLKSSNLGNYNSLIDYLFNPTDGANSAGFTFLRVPLGASDFSANTYDYDNSNGDTSYNNFNIDNTPSYVFSTISDIKAVNSILKVHILPWSPPGWTKDSGSMDGGSLQSQYVNSYATYLLKCVEGFNSKGIRPYSIAVQNEPENSNPSYPTATIPVATEATIGNALRTLLNNNGYSDVKIIGYEHNWIDAGAYPVQLMQQASSAFTGASFHCYQGSYSDQGSFTSAYPDKEVYFTECTGEIGSDWWSDIKWYMDNLMIGSLEYSSRTALMWNLALDSSGGPELPGSNSCDPACRGVVEIDGGSWSVNQEFYAMGQASKAIIPRDSGGPFGQMIGVTLGGSESWALRVSAFVTRRVNPTDWNRYSLVVLNWNDNTNGNWDPQNVQTTIEFRGMQASYSFPVGVTTLWWYAEN